MGLPPGYDPGASYTTMNPGTPLGFCCPGSNFGPYDTGFYDLIRLFFTSPLLDFVGLWMVGVNVHVHILLHSYRQFQPTISKRNIKNVREVTSITRR